MAGSWLLAARVVLLGVVLGALAAAPTPAHADAPSIQIGHLGPQVTIERALLVIRAEPRPAAHLVLSLAATHITRRELVATIWIPAGARVTSFAYTGGEEERAVARPMPARRAGEAYVAVKGSTSGALVDAAGPDAIFLRVPIAEDLPGEVELEIALPRLSAITLDPGGQHIARAEVRLDGAPPRRWEDLRGPLAVTLPKELRPAVPPGSGVSAETSLVLGDVPTVHIGPVVHGCG